MTPANRPALSQRGIARLYGIAWRTVAADCRSGRLPSRKRGRAIVCSTRIAERLYGVPESRP